MYSKLKQTVIFLAMVLVICVCSGTAYAEIPGPPTNVMATGVAWGAIVEFMPPEDGGDSDITEYVVTSTPDSITATGSSSPITVSGLSAGVSYYFSILAINADGPGIPAESNEVMVSAPFDPPTIVDITAGNSYVTVTFDPPYDSNYTGYRVTSDPGYISVTGTQSPITVAGLTNGTFYTFRVTAISGPGESVPSLPSVSVTPSADSTDQGNGPHAGPVQCLAVDPISSETVYAGTYGGGVYKTSDGGMTWIATNQGMSATDVMALVIDPSANQTVYAGTANGVFKTTDGGVSWVNLHGGYEATALVIDPANTQALYAGTMGGVYKTADGGTNWIAVNNGLPAAEVTALSIDPTGTGMLYAAISGGGLYKTIDGGTTWSIVVPEYYSMLSSLVIDPEYPLILYAGRSWDGSISKTMDGGLTWENVTPGQCPDNISYLGTGSFWCHAVIPGNYTAIVLDPTKSPTVFAGTSYGVQKTTDGGLSWKTIITRTDVLSLAIPASAQNVYVGTSSGTVFKIANSPSPPAPPANVTATAGNGQAMIEFTPPADDGGSNITHYIVTSAPANITVPGSSSPITVPGLSNGTTYSFTVVAVNLAGNSTDAYTGSVTPIASYTVTPVAVDNVTITPDHPQSVVEGLATTIAVISESGYGAIATGCGGALTGTTYTTGRITSDCDINVSTVRRSGSTSGSEPTVVDAIKAFRCANGLSSLTPEERIAYDVAPLGPTGSPVGNETLDVADVILILRRSIGIGSW